MTSDPLLAKLALSCLDLTNLDEACDEAAIAALAAKAGFQGGHVAALCVWPRFIETARRALGDAPVRIATVINFPAGTGSRSAIADEAQEAVRLGADEIDLVFNHAAFLAGRRGYAETLVGAVRAVMPTAMPLKVILETGILPTHQIGAAAQAAAHAGADFLKTSTGKVAQGASLEAARALLDVIARSDRPVGLKISGGVRSLSDARAYMVLAESMMGAGFLTPSHFRFGASGLYDALAAVLAGRSEGKASGGY